MDEDLSLCLLDVLTPFAKDCTRLVNNRAHLAQQRVVCTLLITCAPPEAGRLAQVRFSQDESIAWNQCSGDCVADAPDMTRQCRDWVWVLLKNKRISKTYMCLLEAASKHTFDGVPRPPRSSANSFGTEQKGTCEPPNKIVQVAVPHTPSTPTDSPKCRCGRDVRVGTELQQYYSVTVKMECKHPHAAHSVVNRAGRAHTHYQS